MLSLCDLEIYVFLPYLLFFLSTHTVGILELLLIWESESHFLFCTLSDVFNSSDELKFISFTFFVDQFSYKNEKKLKFKCS